MSLKLNESQITIGLTTNSFWGRIALFFTASCKVDTLCRFNFDTIFSLNGMESDSYVESALNWSIFQKQDLMCEAHEGPKSVFRSVPRVRTHFPKMEGLRVEFVQIHDFTALTENMVSKLKRINASPSPSIP